jgi:hypothetical protein
MPQLLGKLALLATTLLFCCGVGEVTLRLLPDVSGTKMRDGELRYRFNPFRPDGVLSYALRPDAEAVHAADQFQVTVRTNSLGLRGGPAPSTPAPGTYRILVLGDSFGFGFGVEDDETFAALLADGLELDGRPVEVLNGSVPGWSADHYLLFLMTRGFALEPDLVLLAPSENDPGDLGWHRLELDEANLPVRLESTVRLIDHRGRMRYVRGAPDFTFPGSAWLSRHSHLFHWIRFRVTKAWLAVAQRSELARREAAAGPAPEGPIPELTPEQVQRGLESGEEFQLRYHRYLLAAVARESERRGIALRTLHVAYRREPGSERSTVTLALQSDCAEAAHRCLDSETIFRDEEVPEAFLQGDGHWSAWGHARIAETVREWLLGDPELADPTPVDRLAD